MKQQLINGVRPLYNELVYYRNPLIKIHQKIIKVAINVFTLLKHNGLPDLI